MRPSEIDMDLEADRLLDQLSAEKKELLRERTDEIRSLIKELGGTRLELEYRISEISDIAEEIGMMGEYAGQAIDILDSVKADIQACTDFYVRLARLL